jgi:hypothetical protein
MNGSMYLQRMALAGWLSIDDMIESSAILIHERLRPDKHITVIRGCHAYLYSLGFVCSLVDWLISPHKGNWLSLKVGARACAELVMLLSPSILSGGK